jgi:hypothetical protein
MRAMPQTAKHKYNVLNSILSTAKQQQEQNEELDGSRVRSSAHWMVTTHISTQLK